MQPYLYSGAKFEDPSIPGIYIYYNIRRLLEKFADKLPLELKTFKDGRTDILCSCSTPKPHTVRILHQRISLFSLKSKVETAFFVRYKQLTLWHIPITIKSNIIWILLLVLELSIMSRLLMKRN